MHDELESGEPVPKTENTWTYQAPPKEKEGFDFAGAAIGLLASILYLGLFSLLPILVFIGMDWIVYTVTRDTFYTDPWVKPTVLMAATFMAGAYARIVMEENFKTMGVFIIGILGLIIFSAVTYVMLDEPGTLYAKWLPAIPSVDPALVFGLPLIGLAGMFCYQFFSLRHYI